MKNVVATSLKDLDPSKFPASGDSLDVDLGEINIPEVKVEEARKVQETAIGIASWMKTHLQKLDGLHAQPEAVQARPDIRRAIKSIWDRIYAYMSHDEAGYRQTAWLEFLLHQFESMEIKTWDDLDRLTNWLAKQHYLDTAESGPLETPWGKCFAIPKIASFGASQFRQIKDAWNKTLKRISHDTVINRAERVKQVKDDIDASDIDILVEKVDGTAILYVPGEISLRNGEMAFFNPGILVARREGDKLFPVEGIGSFDKRIETMIRRSKTFILSRTLDWTRPTSKKMLMEEKGFKDYQADDLYFAWYLFKRANQHLTRSNEEPREELVKLGGEVSIPANEFLLARQEGIALIELDGSVVIIDGEKGRVVIDKAFLLVERNGRKFKVKEIPAHLEPLLNAESFNEEYAEGEQFEGLPQPLQALLKMAYFEAYFKQMLE